MSSRNLNLRVHGSTSHTGIVLECLTLRTSEAVENRRGGLTMPFLCLGFANDLSHEGERPMAIRWRLQRAIPAAFVPELALAV